MYVGEKVLQILKDVFQQIAGFPAHAQNLLALLGPFDNSYRQQVHKFLRKF